MVLLLIAFTGLLSDGTGVPSGSIYSLTRPWLKVLKRVKAFNVMNLNVSPTLFELAT